MKLHLSLPTRNLDASVAFYATLFDAAPKKRENDYALFILSNPGLELALDLDDAVAPAAGEHFGIVVDAASTVEDQAARLRAAGYVVDVAREETCCYAVQTKAWVADPEGRRWETYFVHQESPERDGTTCCP